MSVSEINSLRSLYNQWSPEKLHRLAHAKRFLERFESDASFRDQLRDNADDLLSVAKAYGIDIDPDDLLPQFSPAHLKYKDTAEEAQWPLSQEWSAYRQQFLDIHFSFREQAETPETNPAYHVWRQRQIARGMSELGNTGPILPHRVAAYELSDGCSIGCWFCGISADKFKGPYDYTPENAALWRGVLSVMSDRFGDAAGTAFCYWATDPMDNPNYDKFIRDHCEVTGFLPQTTTSAPFKDLELTRRTLSLFHAFGHAPNRFSILTLKTLNRVHETFTAEEMMGVDMVTRNTGSLRKKASAGRALDRKEKMEAAGRGESVSLNDLHTTIACVSGFLVNMPKRTVRLVSPTASGDRWQMGYRVYEEAEFTDAADFRRVVAGMIDRHCVNELHPEDRLAYRPDLTYAPLPDGFILKSKTRAHRKTGRPYLRQLGDMIARGTMTTWQVQSALMETGIDVFQTGAVLQELFDRGLLDDDPKYGGIGVAARSTAPDAPSEMQELADVS